MNYLSNEHHFVKAAGEYQDEKTQSKPAVSFLIQQSRYQQVITGINKEGQVCHFDKSNHYRFTGRGLILVAQVIPYCEKHQPKKQVMQFVPG